MSHIILTGATGTVGSAVLAHALQSPAISRISIMSRRSVKAAEDQPKARVIVQTDFEVYEEDVLNQLKGATACIWAQGISSRGMQEAEYSKITVDYPLAAARAFARLGDSDTNFVYVSGEGANMDGSRAMLDKLARGAGSVLKKVWKSMIIPTDSLAKVLVDLAVGNGDPVAAGDGVEADGRVLRNTAIRRLAGL